MTGIVLHAANISNASASMLNSTNSVGTVILPIAWIALLAVGLGVVRSSKHFEKFANAAQVLATSIYYAVHGLAAVTALAILLAPVYLFSQSDAGTQSAVGYAVVAGIAIYAVLTVLGYAVRRWFVEPAAENARKAGWIGAEEVSADGD